MMNEEEIIVIKTPNGKIFTATQMMAKWLGKQLHDIQNGTSQLNQEEQERLKELYPK